MGLVTQQDLIGIAGGLNLYGYANGDPVNYSDPFGLCPPIWDCIGALISSGVGNVVGRLAAARTGGSTSLAGIPAGWSANVDGFHYEANTDIPLTLGVDASGSGHAAMGTSGDFRVSGPGLKQALGTRWVRSIDLNAASVDLETGAFEVTGNVNIALFPDRSLRVTGNFTEGNYTVRVEDDCNTNELPN